MHKTRDALFSDELSPIGAGVTIGPYILRRPLGRGGMGTVFEARHRDLGSSFAIKLLHPQIAADAAARRRFLREAQIAAKIRHPHVVSVVDVGETRGTPYIVMELLEGETLAAKLAAEAPLPVGRIVEWMLPILSAVSAAHAEGIVHRDLKPENIVLCRRRYGELAPVVLDFGISKVARSSLDASLTNSDAVLGTLHYMAPEQARAAKLASDLSDQYSLGVILYLAATGRTPFTGEGHYELMHAVVTAPVVAPRAINPSLSPAMEAIVMRAMARDPARRYSSVIALGEELLAFADAKTRAVWGAEFLDEASLAGELTAAPHTPARRWTHGAIVATCAVALSSASIVVGALRAGSREPRWAPAPTQPAAEATPTVDAAAVPVPEAAPASDAAAAPHPSRAAPRPAPEPRPKTGALPGSRGISPTARPSDAGELLSFPNPVPSANAFGTNGTPIYE